MALISPGSALSNYQQIMGMGPSGFSESTAASAAPSFNDVMKRTLSQSAEALRHHENMAIQQTVGEGDITKVITSAAELDVKTSTAVALRDKLISLIQELNKMQI